MLVVYAMYILLLFVFTTFNESNISHFGYIELKKIHDEVRHRGLTWFNSFRPEIKAEILRTVGFPPSTEDNWEQLVDGPAWTWWLLSLLPLGANVQVSLYI